MKKLLILTLTVLLFSCQKEEIFDDINENNIVEGEQIDMCECKVHRTEIIFWTGSELTPTMVSPPQYQTIYPLLYIDIPCDEVDIYNDSTYYWTEPTQGNLDRKFKKQWNCY